MLYDSFYICNFSVDVGTVTIGKGRYGCKKTPDYDNVFKTMKMKHKRLFVSVINDVFGRNYPRAMIMVL